jgi:hypothetical protein
MKWELESREVLEFRQQQLKRQIDAALDLLEGFLYKSPCMRGYHLAYRSGGRRVTKYVRKRLVVQAQAMVQNRERVEQLLFQLSEVNWRLLQLPPED